MITQHTFFTQRGPKSFIGVLSILIVGACAPSADDDADQSAVRSALPSIAVAPRATVAAADSTAIIVVGAQAEAVYDKVRLGDWAAASHALDSAMAVVRITGHASTPDDSLAFDPPIRLLRDRLTARDRSGVLSAANRLTEIAARRSADLALSVPIEIALLDFYGREMQIAADANDIPGSRRVASALRDVWARVRPQMDRHDGAEERMAFDVLVVRSNSATTDIDVASLAQQILDAVDGIESLFKT